MIINICNCRSSWVFAGNAKRCLPCSHWLRWFSTNCFHIKNLLFQFPSIKKVAIDSYNLDNRLYIFDAGQLIANNLHPAAFTSKIYVICRIELWSKRCSPCCTFACIAQEIRLLNKDPSLDQTASSIIQFICSMYYISIIYAIIVAFESSIQSCPACWKFPFLWRYRAQSIEFCTFHRRGRRSQCIDWSCQAFAVLVSNPSATRYIYPNDRVSLLHTTSLWMRTIPFVLPEHFSEYLVRMRVESIAS